MWLDAANGDSKHQESWKSMEGTQREVTVRNGMRVVGSSGFHSWASFCFVFICLFCFN